MKRNERFVIALKNSEVLKSLSDLFVAWKMYQGLLRHLADQIF